MPKKDRTLDGPVFLVSPLGQESRLLDRKVCFPGILCVL